MLDWKWATGIILTLLGLISAYLLVPAIRNYYKIFQRLAGIEQKLENIDSNEINDRLIKIEKDTEFATKAIWQFLIAKVHSDDDEFKIDELLDKWKQHKLIKVEEIERLMLGLNKIVESEVDGSKRAAAELLLNMLNKGIGIVTRM